MQTRSKVFDDLAKVAGGAVSTLGGIKAEIEVLIRQQIERFLRDANMVPRDEFDAVKAMAAKARSEQEKLEKRVKALESKLGVKAPKKKPAKAPTKAKAARKAPRR
ncbi:MAG: accessory factor UbiK family protein [Rhodospirillales bacterium]|nr:accessory factor UbiK family protein [Rhodospirillales bacterium]